MELAVGIPLAAVGLAGLIGGIAVYSSAPSYKECHTESDGTPGSALATTVSVEICSVVVGVQSFGTRLAGGALATLGGLSLTTGAILSLVGADRLTNTRAVSPSPVPEVSVGPAAATLRWTF